jgi:hypothetical protein
LDELLAVFGEILERLQTFTRFHCRWLTRLHQKLVLANESPLRLGIVVNKGSAPGGVERFDIDTWWQIAVDIDHRLHDGRDLQHDRGVFHQCQTLNIFIT